MKNLKNKVAVVTGAGSGIGRELAVELAALGCHLAISDVNEKGLTQTAAMLNGASVNVTTHILDVSDRDAFYVHANEVKKAHSKVDIVINNAGVAMGSTLENTTFEDFEWVMGINFWGVVYGTKAFLPMLRESKDANLVNVSSINGIVPSPTGGPYACSKYAVRAFTETLMMEIKDSNINFSVVHPGGIKTNISRDARFRMDDVLSHQEMTEVFETKIFRLTANEAARIIIKGIQKNKQRIMVGSDAKFLDRFRRLAPMLSLKIIGNSVSKMMGV